jgi:hypothetical protein
MNPRYMVFNIWGSSTKIENALVNVTGTVLGDQFATLLNSAMGSPCIRPCSATTYSLQS